MERRDYLRLEFKRARRLVQVPPLSSGVWQLSAKRPSGVGGRDKMPGPSGSPKADGSCPTSTREFPAVLPALILLFFETGRIR